MSTEASSGALVAETRALIEEVEAGNTDRAAWVAIRDRVRRLMEGRTQAEVGELVGKSRTWVGELVVWNAEASASPTPWGGDFRATANRALVGARKIARENPAEIAEAIKAAPPEARAAAYEAIATDADEREAMITAGIKALPKRQASPKPGTRPAKTWSAILSYLDNARRGMERALEELRDQPELPEQVEERLTEETRKVVASGELLIAYLESGGSSGMVADISEYLAAQAAGEENTDE